MILSELQLLSANCAQQSVLKNLLTDEPVVVLVGFVCCKNLAVINSHGVHRIRPDGLCLSSCRSPSILSGFESVVQDPTAVALPTSMAQVLVE